jgi:hypothetical protein
VETPIKSPLRAGLFRILTMRCRSVRRGDSVAIPSKSKRHNEALVCPK